MEGGGEEVVRSNEEGVLCPSCHLPFDGGKKRKLIDTCGHGRCYSCLFSSERCPVCVPCGSNGSPQPSPSCPRYVLPILPPNISPDTYVTTTTVPSSDRHHDQSDIDSGVAIHVKDNSDEKGEEDCEEEDRNTGGIASHREHAHYASERNLKHTEDNLHVQSPDAANKDPITRSSLMPGDIQFSMDSLQSNKRRPGPPPPSPAELGLRHHPTLLSLHNTAVRDPLFTSTSSLSSSSIDSTTPETEMSDTSRKSSLTVSSISEYCFAGRISSRRRKSKLFIAGNRKGSLDSAVSMVDPGMPLAQPSELGLQPLVFEVPHPEGTPLFIGRQWVFEQMDTVLNGETDRQQPGVVILGGMGTGKTAIMEQLLAHSCFQQTLPHPVTATHVTHPDNRSNGFSAHPAPTHPHPSRPQSYPTSRPQTHHLPSSALTSTSTLPDVQVKRCWGCLVAGEGSGTRNDQALEIQASEVLHRLGSQVVGYHLCQADNNLTCLVPDFVHSLAAHLTQAPQLQAYTRLLTQDPDLVHSLSWKQCVENPSAAFINGILDPLKSLQKHGHILAQSSLVLVDAVNEAEFHKPDHGDTIASFLVRHSEHFPSWLKLVMTCQTALHSIVRPLPFLHIVLDKGPGCAAGAENPSVIRDVQAYIDYRLQCSATLRCNAAVHNKSDSAAEKKFCSRLQSLSKGCFLYIKMVLDLLERGQLVVKSTSYKALPISVSEVFLLHFNIHFSSVRSFERVSAILAVCLAAVQPLPLRTIYTAVNAGYLSRYVGWEEFCHRMALLSPFLYRRHDGRYVFFHPAFREWLIVREDSDTSKFLCDLRLGHALMALHLSRSGDVTSPEQTLELGHHMLKAHIYKSMGRQRGFSSRDVQAYWMCLSSGCVSLALATHRNIFSPNIKVSRLVLLAGADPNVRTEVAHNAPLLCMAAREGFADLVMLLLDFGADVDVTSDTGMTPLCYAAASGHLEVMRILYSQKARPCLLDKEGQCAAVHAALCGQLGSLSLLLQLKWRPLQEEPSREEAILQCLSVAAATNNSRVVEYLHGATRGEALNMVDTLLGETALTAACVHGHKELVQYILEEGADTNIANCKTFPPLLCAVKSGHWETTRTLLLAGADIEQTDKHGRTALMLAASYGHLRVLDLLLCKGAQLESTDREGLTALCWACLKGHVTLVQSLFYRGADVQHCDVNGRTPLHLAASCGDVQVVEFLMNKGAAVEHVDIHGMRPVDRAVGSGNTAIIGCFLQRDAKLEPETWAMAAGNSGTVVLLLNKLREDGNTLYKKRRMAEAEQRYKDALKQVPEECDDPEAKTFHDLKISLLLKLSHCKRRQKDYPAAIDLATQALDLNPHCLQAYDARARAQRGYQQYGSAQADLTEALHLAPSDRRLLQLLARIKEECTQQICSETVLDVRQRYEEEYDSSPASDVC